MTVTRPVPVVLSIAGSDSGGGAGIQADLKAFAAAGVHGTTAITAITVQNTVAVSAVETVAPEIISAQIRVVAEDLGVDAVKIGMLGDVATIEAVAAALDALPGDPPVVHDPVMVAESGARLLPDDALTALVRLILPRATVVTPNLQEARVLAGPGAEELDGEELARAVHALGPRAVIVTGGHRDAGHRPALRRPAPSRSSPASATPTARPTARAARTPRRSRRVSRWATRCPRQPGGRARRPPPRSATACANSAQEPVPSTSSASRSAARDDRKCPDPGLSCSGPRSCPAGESALS